MSENASLRLPSRLARGVLRAYQAVFRPVLAPTCRFSPSCSDYAIDAIGAHGIAKGGWLAARRLARCGPFTAGGWDPVPGKAK
jgi:putative membrane protein insertion efficiency factor